MPSLPLIPQPVAEAHFMLAGSRVLGEMGAATASRLSLGSAGGSYWLVR